MASSAFNVSDLTSKAIDFSWESDNSIEFCYYYLFLSLAEFRLCCRRSQEFLIRVGLLGAYLVSIFFYFYYSLSVGFLSSIDSFLTLEMLLIYLFQSNYLDLQRLCIIGDSPFFIFSILLSTGTINVFWAICSASSQIFFLDSVLGRTVWAKRCSLSYLRSNDSPDP